MKGVDTVMKMKPEELAEMIKKQTIEALTPYLKVQRPEAEEEEVKDKKIFSSFGDFIKSIVLKDANDEKAIAKMLEYRTKTLSMDSDPQGGYLVPEQFSKDLLKVASEDGIVRSLATVIPAGSPSPDAELNIPVLNQAGAAEKDFFSGVWFTWTNEGGAKADKEPDFDTIKLAPEEYAASTILTDKIIRNAGALEGYVKAVYQRAQVAFEDYYFLRGNGVNQPLGVIGSPPYIEAARAVINQIAFADIIDMMMHILPGCNPIWVISRSCYAMIVNLSDTAGNSIYKPGDTSKGIPDKLMGHSIKWTWRVPALGTVGDISLCDFSYYLIKDGYGPAFDTSKHVHFLSNKTVLKMFSNVDGQPWLNGTITAEDDATEVSPFVGLRAAGA